MSKSRIPGLILCTLVTLATLATPAALAAARLPSAQVPGTWVTPIGVGDTQLTVELEDATSRLVALPVGITEVAPVAVTVVGSRGTLELGADQIRTGPVMIMRGQPLVAVSLTNPEQVEREVGRIASVRVTLTHDRPAAGGHAPLALGGSAGTPPQTNCGVYVIIAADEYFLELSDLIAWKTREGYDVKAYAMSEIGTTRDDVLGFLQDAYDSWDEPPFYVLLVGDVEDVPTWDVKGNVSDHPYALLDGDDFLADVFIGRFSAKNPQEVAVQVAKTVGYESAPDTSDGGAWCGRAMLVAGNSGSTTPKATSRWIQEQLYDIGYTQIDSCYYKPYWGEGPVVIKHFVDPGVSIVNYRGWAYGDIGWEPPKYTVDHIPQLMNGWRLPVVFSIVCHTGNFGNAEVDCFGEVWMKTGSVAEPRGAVAFVGTAEGWSHSRWNDRMAIGIFEAFCHQGIHQVGPVLEATKVGLMPQFPTELYMGETQIEESVEYYNKIYHLLGDPSLRIWTGKPRPLTVEHPAEIALGENYVAVRVFEKDGETPVPGARIALSQDDSAIGFAIADENGMTTIGFRTDSTHPIALTVTGENLYPWQAELAVATQSRHLACTGANVSGGGDLVAGVQNVRLELDVRNTGAQDLSNVTATITGPQGVEIVEGTASFGSIGAGSTASADVVVSVDAKVEHGTVLRFLLGAMASGSPVATTEFRLTASAPDLRSVGIAGHEDDHFDPDEEGDLFVTLQNDGVAAGEISATLRSLLPDTVAVLDSVSTYAEIASGEERSNDGPFVIRIAKHAPVGTVVPMELVVESADGPSGVVHFNLVVGQVDFSAPTGPDSYGYFCLDSADIEYPGQAPIYEWIECSPHYGGEGTALEEINNNIRSQVVQLPFSFTYYGVSYDSVRVSDNGWIAFDTSYWYDIRNWSMPSKWGSACQVAPFWDNLDPSLDLTDGFYAWYDAPNHLFVIEWSRLKNWEDNTDDYQTFELILRDPEHYVTPTGDGEIIFQYKQIVNDDSDKMYATVGIEDHSEEIGLLYTYSNLYEPGAAPLAPGLAIKFTTAKPHFEAIELSLFEARWAGGSLAAGPGQEPDGDDAAVLVRWELTDERPLSYLELFCVGPDGEAQKVSDEPLPPESGQLYDTSADPTARCLYHMVGVDPAGKRRVIGETTYSGSPKPVATLQLVGPRVITEEARVLYNVGQEELRRLAVFDVTGRMVRDLRAEVSGARFGTLTWDGRDDRGARVPGGVYWVRLQTSATDRSERLLVVR